MPIADDNTGWSKETPEKARIINAYMGKRLRHTIDNIAKKYNGQHFPFHYIDLFCGSGINHDPDRTESLAITILRQLQEVSWNWRADLIDKGDANGRPNIEVMREMLDRRGIDLAHIKFHYGSYQENLPGIVEGMSMSKIGLVLIDPNTPTECLDAAMLLNAYPNKLRMVDHLYHFAAMGWKRYRGYAQRRGITYDREFPDLLEASGKDRFLIRRSTASQQQWVFIHATNASANTLHQWIKDGWHDAETPIGEKIVEDLTYTKPELKRRFRGQLNLWDKQ